MKQYAKMLNTASVVVFLLPFAAAAQPALEPQVVDGKIDRVYSYADGQRTSKETGKPMFVVFRCER